MIKKLDLGALDELNHELAFVESALEVIKILALNELLSTVDEGMVASISCEALNKLKKIEELLNSEEV